MGTTMKTGKMLSGEGEETELRLGLPGGGAAAADGELTVAATAARKRGFSETEDQMSLKLNLQLDGSNSSSTASVAVSSSLDLKKNNDIMGNNKKGDTPVKNNMESNHHHHDAAAVKPPAKAQVVGWPPVRSYRKNMMAVQQNMSSSKDQMVMNLVKVSIDGAPYLRKVDLKMYRSYQDLSDALGKMFSSFTIGSHGMIDFMNESKLMDLLNGSDYVPTYEDKDGDWMLVGDVPWEMFMESCKRMRIMKGKEAVGLAPRAMEKCKNKRAS